MAIQPPAFTSPEVEPTPNHLDPSGSKLFNRRESVGPTGASQSMEMFACEIGNLSGIFTYTGVSENRGTPKSSIKIRFSIINHPFWGTPIFGNTHLPLFTIKLTHM